MTPKILELISLETGISKNQVQNTITLLIDEGATIPFVARYRKERTGSLDEVQITQIQKLHKKYIDLEARKESIIATIEEQGKLTDELRSRILNSYNPDEVEDLYLPYKKRKKTRADVAKENGLEPLAKIIMSQRGQDINKVAATYLNEIITSGDLAIAGAQDIIAEWISEDQDVRERLRNTFRKYATIVSKVVPKKKEEAEKYKDYFEFEESLSRCPSHRYLAMMRGEYEGMLRISLTIDDVRALQQIDRKYIKSNSQEADLIADAIEDGYKRLIIPSIEGQMLSEFKEKADEEAILVFATNLRQLLLAAPVGQKRIMAIDPGYRTGCKVVCLDGNGDFLSYETIFLPEMSSNMAAAGDKLRSLAYKYEIQVIGIGNGTASRETKDLVERTKFDRSIDVYMVNESGASIYSASDVAREEFPDKDVTVRGAISIGRRLMDPLAELVKIDPKSIGVGQYQHDVHQGKLKETLDLTVESCVNSVGVNINTASKYILTHIAGLGPTLAQNIVDYRRINGDFTSIKDLTKVPRLGQKAFEQAAGFLRIRDGKEQLDNTGVHPESYHIVEKMAKDQKTTIAQLIADKSIRTTIKLDSYISENCGLPTLIDIMKELDKPGLDPRGEAKTFDFDKSIKSISDLVEGMVIPGIITNLTAFGAFVDIGVKQDGLLHISQISRKRIQSPSEVLSLQQEVTVKVIGVEVDRKRINLSLFV
jgi:protein Tex